MKLNVGRLINQGFECPSCRAFGTWNAAARVMVRDESTIQEFQCGRCHEEIVAKVPRAEPRSRRGVEAAEKEYLVLRELLTVFPQDDRFGTLDPLGYLEFDGCAAMITRKFNGVSLIRHASTLSTHGLGGLFRPAGVLLRKLHDSCPRDFQPQLLGVEDKIAYLARTYAADFRRDRSMRTIYDQLVREAAPISGFHLRATWSHGDFKPENVLCDGHKYVILDTQLEGHGAFVYDLASFLSHLLITGQSAKRSDIRRGYQQAEEEFLEGYGGINRQELAALRWAQLYFMLHYWGRYRQRGLLQGIYANLRIRPLAQKLVGQL